MQLLQKLVQSFSKSAAPKYNPDGIREFSFEIDSNKTQTNLKGYFHVLNLKTVINRDRIVQFYFNTDNTDKQH